MAAADLVDPSNTGPLGVEHLPFVPGQIPMMIVASQGCELITADGRRILDGAGGAVVGNIGYGRADVAEVARKATEEIGYVVPVWATPSRVALRDRLVRDWLPEGLTRVGFCSGGSESADSAIRLAVAHHVARGQRGKVKVIGRWPSYHGATVASLSAGGHRARRAGYEGIIWDFPHVPWDDPEALEAMIEAQGPETVAAFIAEPVIGAAGAVLIPPDDYFSKVAEICRRYDVLLIVDEVMSGFGRAGYRFLIDRWKVTPDIAYGGKGLGGGYVPIGGVYATDAVVAPLAHAGHNFMYFTFTGHSSTCAVADKVLQILDEEGLVERSAKLGLELAARLEGALGEHPHVSAIRCIGLWAGVELVAERSPHTWFPREKAFNAAVVGEALRRDVWLYPSGSGDPVQDAVMVAPPLTVSESELDRIVDTLAASIDAAAAALRTA
jgi:adenosylmethionine-8-amino-7-oxononanoate aminotransferase